MKKLRNSFALLVALAAVATTLMSNKLITRKQTGWETARCFTDPITVKYTCANSTEEINSSLPCIYARDYEHGAHVFDINPNNYIEASDIATECYGQDSFCCAQVLTDQTFFGHMEAPCLDQPYFTLDGIYSQFEIDKVYCKLD